MRRALEIMIIAAVLAGCGKEPAPGPEPVPTPSAQPAPMTDAQRVEAVLAEVLAAEPRQTSLGARQVPWRVRVRVRNDTDIDLDGVELRAAIYPPGNLAPLGTHVRDLMFDPPLPRGKEARITLTFPVTATEAASETLRKEVKVAAILRPTRPQAAWQVLDEHAIDMVQTAPPPKPDPAVEARKLRDHLVRQAASSKG